ncbi:MAG: glycosyltransferase family 4 protein [Elusimicrobiota bacterium]
MKIIVSTHDSLSPIRGGGALRTLKCAEEFKKLGHDVTLIAPTDGIGEVSGIPVHWLHAPRKQRSQILSSLKFNVRLLRKFMQMADTTDMFFVHNTVAAATIPFLRLFYKFRFVLDVTDVHAEYLAAARRNPLERLLTPLILAIEYWIIGSADHVIVVTRAMKDLLVKNAINADKIIVIYDAAEIEKIETGKDAGSENAVIHLGSVDRQHGVELFISAIPLVAAARPEARFYIVGGGRELPNVIKLAEKLGVSGLCVFTGTLPCDEARRYMRKAAIGVIPRQDELPNRIVTTLKIYEYWAAETAVVASRLEGIAEIAEDGRDILFFRAGSATDLAEKIVKLLGDRGLTESLARQGAVTVTKHTWSNTVPKIADFALSPGTDK